MARTLDAIVKRADVDFDSVSNRPVPEAVREYGPNGFGQVWVVKFRNLDELTTFIDKYNGVRIWREETMPRLADSLGIMSYPHWIHGRIVIEVDL